MCRLRYFIITIMAMMLFVSNIAGASFPLAQLKETQSSFESSISKKSSLDSIVSNDSSFSSSKLENRRVTEPFLNFWNLTTSPQSILSNVQRYRDFALIDEDSIQLVIGVNNAYPNVPNSLAHQISEIQGKIVNTVSMKSETIAIVADVPLTMLSSFVNSLRNSDLIRYVEPNWKYQALFVPNDPYWTSQWGPQMIEADYAWDTTVGNSSVLVAVIDTGIDYNHPDLRDNYVALGHNWVNNTDDPRDDHGHGTHCAGIVAAVLNNSIGVAGLAQVRVMAEKGLDSEGYGYEDVLANAIIHAVDQGAKILSNSWGGSFDSVLLHEAVQYAYNHGVLVVAAAGNSASSAKNYPAAYDEVVAVTATDPLDNYAYFTSYGNWVEVAAPGVDIYSTMPTYHVTANDHGYPMNYGAMSGTSMACPHVAGVAALIWSRFPNASRDWVRLQLRQTAEDKGDSGFDIYYGYGRINAKNAVEQYPPEHDLVIFDIEKPKYIQPGDSSLLNVTVLNFGVVDEENVTVEFFVEGNLTSSAIVDYLANLTSTTVSLLWVPSAEGIYNVTFRIVPVANETNIENNVLSMMITVRYIVGYVLFDQTRCDPIDFYSIWTGNLTDRGYAVDTYSAGYITSELLSNYDIFVVVNAWYVYSDDELLAIQDFVRAGGGLLVIGDYDYSVCTDLTSFAGITWEFYFGWSGTTNSIVSHPVTENVDAVYFEYPMCKLSVDSSATGLVLGGVGYSDIMLAVSEVEAGRVIALSDQQVVDDWSIGYDDNLQLANNMIDWLLGTKFEHELVVRLDAPSYLLPNSSTLINATVYNKGLSDEVNVTLLLIIDHVTVTSANIPSLENGTKYTMTHNWTPSTVATYNITAYAPPVLGENLTLNNVKTKFVNVRYPLINPEPGQYAKYMFDYYSSSGNLLGQGYMNITYEYYIEPHKIYITLTQKTPDGVTFQGWMIVNTMNRYVESGVWARYWYPGWIETNIDIGSSVNLLEGTAVVNGSKTLVSGPWVLDCWELAYSMYGVPYDMCYDKASGLWVFMTSTSPFGEYIELFLVETNIPLGTPHEHDVGVTLDAPHRLQLGKTALISATVYNVGMSSETNVEIQILINNTIVANASVNLDVGTWYTLNYLWTPNVEGTYNIAVHAPPLADEDVLINNVASRLVDVRVISVALISAYTELSIITPILDSMGISYDIYYNNNMYIYTQDLSLLLNYKAIILYARSKPLTLSEFTALESYLSHGGTLLVTGYDCLVSDMRLQSLVRSLTFGDNVGESDLIVVDSLHPIMNGPYGSFPHMYHIYGLYSDCDKAEADTTRNAVTVAALADGYDKIIATKGLPGKVVFWNGDGAYDWSGNADCQTMLKNLIHWFLTGGEHDLKVSLQAPTFLEPGNFAVLNATVKNNGEFNETDVNLQLLINGTIVKNETVSLLLCGATYTLNYLWFPNLIGNYNITVYAPPVLNETMTTNNIISKIVPVQYAPRILAYVEHTDYTPDYLNVLNSINSTFGPNYILTEFNDYTQLDSMISGKDILLIPDQEYASLSTTEMIGETWSESLHEFLANGGTIILCDGGQGSGSTYGILTGAELMQIASTNPRNFYMLHLVDPTDSLGEGVSASFQAPPYTVSFVTAEANAVVNDGTYPVVIHKIVGKGHIALLGFDFELPLANTKRILANAVKLGLRIILSSNLSVGSPNSEVKISGNKATPNGTVSIYWDNAFRGNTTADSKGNFQYLLTVPEDASAGLHEIKAIDIATGRTASLLFRVIQISLNPFAGPIGTKVTVEGSGFLPNIQAKVTFNDVLLDYARVDDSGNFAFTFNVPLSATGFQTIKVFETETTFASALFTVVDVTPLDVAVDVGAIHFLGEVAEFYAQVVYKGIAVNATSVDALLYKPSGSTESLPTQLIANGLYKIAYTILGNETGTYALVVTASYYTDTVRSDGTSFKCFLVSNTLTLMNNRVIEIKDGIALVQKDVGYVKLNLTAMNVSLQTIFLKVLSINGTVATIQTTIGVMNGTITTIKDNFATIVVPNFDQITTDISSLMATQESWTIQQYATLIIALIAAVSSMLSLFLHARKKPKEAK